MTKNITVTKIFEFEAAHYINGYNGPCKDMHGHTYKLEIEVAGEVKDNGFVFDFSSLKTIVNREVISRLDHKVINDVIQGLPTAERMVYIIASWLSPELNVVRVRLWETSTSYAEWRKA